MKETEQGNIENEDEREKLIDEIFTALEDYARSQLKRQRILAAREAAIRILNNIKPQQPNLN